MSIRHHLAVLLAPAALLLTAPAAHAAGGIDVDVTDGALRLEKLAPGYGGSAEVRVSNGSEHDADVTLRVSDVVDEENGCLRQEVASGDTSCAADGGELSRWLRVSLDHAGTPLWEGPLSALAGDGVVVADALPAGSVLPLTVRVVLPREAGNDTMTDRVGFALRVDAAADLTEVAGVEDVADGADEGDGAVLGVEAGAGGGEDGDGSGVLPFTGSDVAPWLPLTGAFLLGAGGYLVATRRRRTPEPA